MTVTQTTSKIYASSSPERVAENENLIGRNTMDFNKVAECCHGRIIQPVLAGFDHVFSITNVFRYTETHVFEQQYVHTQLTRIMFHRMLPLQITANCTALPMREQNVVRFTCKSVHPSGI